MPTLDEMPVAPVLSDEYPENYVALILPITDGFRGSFEVGEGCCAGAYVVVGGKRRDLPKSECKIFGVTMK